MRLVLIFLTLLFLSEAHVVKRQTNDIFQDVVRQKTRGNQIQQCPCVIHPESRQCISYDSRYIAVNYEEAILSFLDLSKHHSGPAPLINSNTFSCQTQECKQCFSLLYHKLGEIGFIPSSYRLSISPIPQDQLNPSLCPRYNFPLPVISPVAPAIVPNYLQSVINAGRQFRSANFPQSARARSNQGSPPAASPPNPANNRNNNGNRNNNNNNNAINPSSRNQNQNQNQNQNSRNPQNGRNTQNGQQGRQNFNQNNQNNQLQNQRTQFRNNQAMRNRFNAQQRANNAFQNNAQRPFQQQNPNFQQRPWQGQQQFQQPQPQFQQQFQQPQQQFQQFQNPRPFQNFNGIQQRWNGRFWEPATAHAVSEAIRNPIQNAVGNAWGNGNGWGQQGSGSVGGNFPQTPIAVQPAPAPVPAQPVGGWTGGGGDGFGGGGHVGGGWGGGGGQNNNDHGFGNLFGGFGGFKKRQKRAVPPPPVIGKRFTINCLQRGDSEDEMLALCGSCWTWRQLPENYFPRIINELSCKTDDFCLSGWGECVQQYRNIDVLRRDNGRWVPTVITTSTCCDCRVRAGTEIHSLVIGDKH